MGKFLDDEKQGKIGERYFEKYLKKNKITYADVRKNPVYRDIDVDYIIHENDKNIFYEVKYNWKKVHFLNFELLTNCDTTYGAIKFGWPFITKANYIIFVNPLGEMSKLDWNNESKTVFNEIYRTYDVIKNDPTRNSRGIITHQSCYTEIPIIKFLEFIEYIDVKGK